VLVGRKSRAPKTLRERNGLMKREQLKIAQPGTGGVFQSQFSPGWGFDGIAVESYTAPDGGVDIQTVGMEFSFILTQVRKTAEILEVGAGKEGAIRTGALTMLIRVVSSEYFVALAIRPDPDVAREKPAFGLGSDDSRERKVDAAYASERKLVAEERRKTPRLACEVQALRVGPLGIATNGSEYFCEYGLRIKRASRHPTTWVVSLANEWIGYVPTAQAFVGGGYETRTARSSKLAADAGQRLLEGALKALGNVTPAK